MVIHWLDIVLLGLIGLGVLAAVRSLWRRRGSGCCGCGGCRGHGGDDCCCGRNDRTDAG